MWPLLSKKQSSAKNWKTMWIYNKNMGKKTCILTWICTAEAVLVQTVVDILCQHDSPSSVTPVKHQLPIRWHQLINLPLLETAKHDNTILKPPSQSNFSFVWLVPSVFPKPQNEDLWHQQSNSLARIGRCFKETARVLSELAEVLLPFYQHGLSFIICKALKKTCTSSILYKSMIQNKAFRLCWVFMFMLSVSMCLCACVWKCVSTRVHILMSFLPAYKKTAKTNISSW